MSRCYYPGCSLRAHHTERHAVDEGAVLGTLSRDQGNEDGNWGTYCERRGCGHTKAGHVTGTCGWCPCSRFLTPGYDDEPEARDLMFRLRELEKILSFVADWAHDCEEPGATPPTMRYGFVDIEAQIRAALE